MKNKLSVTALVGFITSIVSLLLSPWPIINNFAFPIAILGLILGIVGIVLTGKEKKRGRGIAIASVAVAVIAGVVVLGSQAVYSRAIDQVGKDVSKSLDKSTGNATDELLKNDVKVVLGDFAVVTGEYGTTDTSLPITITNKNAASKSYSVKVEAVTADGTRIEDDSVTVNDLRSGQSQKVEAFKYISPDKVATIKTATFKIVSVSQY